MKPFYTTQLNDKNYNISRVWSFLSEFSKKGTLEFVAEWGFVLQYGDGIVSNT